MEILFWSGGKDAYLALEFHRRDRPDADIRLLTTYDESAEIVPHQQIPLQEIKKQAANLEMELIPVPLPPEASNEVYLERVNQALEKQGKPVERLIFGDWKLEDIRRWREDHFGEMGYGCVFPIWGKSINELLPVLILQPVTVEISAVSPEFQSILRVGETYDQNLVTQLAHLPDDIDPMGENGEFHTIVKFEDLSKRVE